MRKLWAFLGGLTPSALAGAFFLLTLGRVTEPGQANRLALLLLGGLYGVGVVGLIRLFRVAPWAYPLAGLFCGPVPLALVLNRNMGGDERGGLWILSALLGLLIGALEWARVRREEGNSAAG